MILATVSINAVMGENGIIQKAKLAKQVQANAVEAEQEAMDELLEEYANAMAEPPEVTTGPNGYTLITKISGTQTVTTVAEDKNGVKITVPAGFKVRTDLATTAEEGIIIEDESGNQFVWVPCSSTGANGLTKYAQDKQYNDGTTATKQWYYIQDENNTSTKYTDWKDDNSNAQSVDLHGGFYVARYEAGVPSGANFYANTAGATYYTSSTTPSKNVTSYTPVSKAEVQSWNYISQENAKVVSSNMYSGNGAVNSQLIDSYAWDTIMTWMEESVDGIALDSTNYGNYANTPLTVTVSNALYAEHTYTTSWTPATTYKRATITLGSVASGSSTIYKEIATGSLSSAKVRNIYDMAGNMWEWTTEYGYHNADSSGTKYAVLRGGSFGDYGSNDPVSYRVGNGTATHTGIGVGFRVVLYIA